MKANQFIGLVKFFRNEDYLDKLIEGCFHCTPPEVYRLDKQEGISDKFESCSFSYRKSRNDADIQLNVNGRNLTDVLGLTLHNGQQQDSWMHCWFVLRLPNSENDLKQLIEDVKKMKCQFGNHYAFIPNSNLKDSIYRLQKNSELPLAGGEVEYSGDNSLWGNKCKSLEYSYQREFRFLFGECSVTEMAPYVVNIENGLSDLILKDPDLQLTSKDGEQVWFHIRA